MKIIDFPEGLPLHVSLYGINSTTVFSARCKRKHQEAYEAFTQRIRKLERDNERGIFIAEEHTSAPKRERCGGDVESTR